MMKDKSTHALKGEKIHWVGWGINGSSLNVAEQLPFEGSSDFKTTAGYRGPCPASPNSLHNYSIILFALDSTFPVAIRTILQTAADQTFQQRPQS